MGLKWSVLVEGASAGDEERNRRVAAQETGRARRVECPSASTVRISPERLACCAPLLIFLLFVYQFNYLSPIPSSKIRKSPLSVPAKTALGNQSCSGLRSCDQEHTSHPCTAS